MINLLNPALDSSSVDAIRSSIRIDHYNEKGIGIQQNAGVNAPVIDHSSVAAYSVKELMVRMSRGNSEVFFEILGSANLKRIVMPESPPNRCLRRGAPCLIRNLRVDRNAREDEKQQRLHADILSRRLARFYSEF
jgi:hypothetical protein